MCWRSFCTFSRLFRVSVRLSFFVNDFACHFIYLKIMNNEIFHITHLSTDKLSCLNCLPLESLAFDFFCHQILRSHALKIKISKNVQEPKQTFTNVWYLHRVLSSTCRCVIVVKCLFINQCFVMIYPKEQLSFYTSKQPMKPSVFHQNYLVSLNVQSRLHITFPG